MFAKATTNLKGFFNKGHERTLKAKKNIAISFFLKVFSIAISLVIIPLTIHYVNPTQYGIWLTLSSVISWLSFFDIGLGNGLKNKLAESNALGQEQKAAIYVSTTYAILCIISAVFLTLYYILNHFLDWHKILNVPVSASVDLSQLALITVLIFCLQFIVQIINTVLTACHEVSKVSLIILIGQAISLLIIFVLTKYPGGSLNNLILVLAGVPVLIQILASIYLYNTGYKNYMPQFKLIDFKYAKSLLSVGGVFFIIQIGALLLFQTDNIVITQLFGPQEVTVFNISYKLFSVVIMVFTIVMTPFWSAFTDAYAKNDLDWIKRTLEKMKIIWLALSFGCVILYFISSFIYKLWLHNTVTVPSLLSLAMAAYVIGYTWIMLHCYFLNGIGKIKLQLIIYIFSIFLNVPMAIFFGKKLGVAGVTFSNVMIFFVMGVLLWIQCRRIVNGTAKGVWNA